MELLVAKKTPRQSTPSDDIYKSFNLWAISGEIGLNLAIPLLIFMLIGIKIDKALNTTPLFMLAGILLSASISSYLIYRMIKRVNQDSH